MKWIRRNDDESNYEDRRGMTTKGKAAIGGGLGTIIVLALYLFTGQDFSPIVDTFTGGNTNATTEQFDPSRAKENEDLKVLVGQTLARLRRSVGLTQEKLAEIAGLERGYVSLIERGLRMPTIETVFRLCRGLNCSPSELIRDVELLACWTSQPPADPSRMDG